MFEIIGKVFRGITVTLDAHKYHLCTFENCTFRWNGAPYEIEQCDVRGFRGIVTGSEAISHTIGLLKALGLLETQFAESWGMNKNVFMSLPTLTVDASERARGN